MGRMQSLFMLKIYLGTNYLSGHGTDYPIPYSTEIKENAELFLYPSNPCLHGTP
jgi:hypothetical protein